MPYLSGKLANMVLKHADSNTAFLESIITSAPIGIVALDEKLFISMINPRGCNYLNINYESKENVLGKPLLSFLQEPFKSKLSERLLSGKLDSDFPEIKLGQRYVTARCRSVKGGALLTFMNISKSKEMEFATYNAMLEGQESERRRIAQEMHDGIGPLLSALKLNIEHLYSQVPVEDPELNPRFDNVVSMLDQVTQEIRNISHSLMPAALMDFGLEAALQQLCRRVTLKGKIQVTFFSNHSNQRFDPNIELGLYRIGQELLNNALKYAAAKEINLQVIRHERSVVLMVEDDGKGFDQKDLQTQMKGIGLMDIQARVKSMEGHFSLESTPGEGVLATVEVPL